MSPLDASFLHLEDDGVSHMHIGSTTIFEGPVPGRDEFDGFVAGKLPLVPRYRQRVRIPPAHLGRPAWVDDPHFNLGYHLRHTALARPGGEAELRTLVGRLMSQRLDRGKPLWEMWKVEGLEDGHWALVSKVHHCMVDGVSGTDLLAVMLDAEPSPPEPVLDTWRPTPEPSTPELVVNAVADLVSNPVRALQGFRDPVATLRDVRAGALDFVKGLASVGGVVRPLPASSLNGPIGPHRRWAVARSTLADVKTIRAALGGTVNDVVLAAIAAGFRDLLAARDEAGPNTVVRTLVPVSVRRPNERGTYNNRVSAMFAELPVGIPDAVERLAAVRTQMERLKESKGAVAGEVLTSLSGFAPAMLLAVGTRVASRVPQRNFNTVTTNVPGPQQPLYALGRRVLESMPYVPIQGRMRIGVAIFSYNGTLRFGITGDYDTAPDIDVLARGIEDGMAELVKAASGPAA
jgi:diacylglycerol O-acyltransferase